MKSALFFDMDAVAEQRLVSKQTFQLQDFPDFDKFYSIDEYIILYNSEAIKDNQVCIPFTNEKFKGNIVMIKIKNDLIENLTIKKFLKLYSKNLKLERLDDDSDSDPFDESCNLKQIC